MIKAIFCIVLTFGTPKSYMFLIQESLRCQKEHLRSSIWPVFRSLFLIKNTSDIQRGLIFWTGCFYGDSFWKVEQSKDQTFPHFWEVHLQARDTYHWEHKFCISCYFKKEVILGEIMWLEHEKNKPPDKVQIWKLRKNKNCRWQYCKVLNKPHRHRRRQQQ